MAGPKPAVLPITPPGIKNRPCPLYTILPVVTTRSTGRGPRGPLRKPEPSAAFTRAHYRLSYQADTPRAEQETSQTKHYSVEATGRQQLLKAYYFIFLSPRGEQPPLMYFAGVFLCALGLLRISCVSWVFQRRGKREDGRTPGGAILPVYYVIDWVCTLAIPKRLVFMNQMSIK